MKDQCRECYWSFYCPEKSRGIACTKYKGPLRNGNSDKGANKKTQDDCIKERTNSQ